MINVNLTHGNHIIPTTIEGWLKLSEIFYSSNTAKKNTQATSVNDMFLILCLGNELGMAPAQTVQNVAMINGKMTVWGDLLLAIVLSSGRLKNINEYSTGSIDEDNMVAICEINRNDGLIGEGLTSTFSIQDAKRAKLYPAKTSFSPWNTYPERMLQMRARGFALRDGFADVLKGVISREEAQDYTLIGSEANGKKDNNKQTNTNKNNTPIDIEKNKKELAKMLDTKSIIKKDEELTLDKRKQAFEQIVVTVCEKISPRYSIEEDKNVKEEAENKIMAIMDSYITMLCNKNNLTPDFYYEALLSDKETETRFIGKFAEWLEENDKSVYNEDIIEDSIAWGKK